ncbi:MAG: S8 family serine peptidase, partial [Thermomicrobiales bacterium]
MRSRLTFIMALLLAVASVNPAIAGNTANNATSSKGNDRPRILETGVLKDVTLAEPAGSTLYNVIFKDSVKDPKAEALALAQAQGFKPTHVYRNLFKGFAGKMTAAQARKLAKNPEVASVEAARRMTMLGQETPTGITRIGVASNPVAKLDGVDDRVDADVMVIDELVDYHPDLNVVSRADCVDGSVSGNELGSGHGTHVAGTIAALDNGSGVVGVAPGARIWSVNVFQNGGAYDTWIACALDAAVAANVDVANMSLGGSATRESACGGNDVMHNAVCRAVNAGVTVVVAAGNSAQDAKYSVPAQYDEVITVSALDDRDGTSSGDRLASFSNFGADVDIAAPGVYVKSTMPGNTLGTMSGTSMAS